jgi:hypothetical protein
MPASHQGVVVFMDTETLLDLFVLGRMGAVAETVASRLEEHETRSSPSNTGIFVVHGERGFCPVQRP